MRSFPRRMIMVGAALRTVSGSAEEAEPIPQAEAEAFTVSAQRENESAREASAFVQQLDRSLWEGRFTTLGELLQQAVGVHVRDFGGLGALATPSLRGSDGDQVVVELDGVRLAAPSGGGMDLSTLPLDAIERIEIVRGGGSAFHGDGAIGGILRLFTRAGSAGPLTQAALSAGSFGTADGRLLHSGRTERSAWTVSGGLSHSEGDFPFINNNGTEADASDDFEDHRDNSALDSGRLLARLGWHPVPQVDGVVQGEFFAANRGVPGLVSAPTPEAHQRDRRHTALIQIRTLEWWPGWVSETRLSHLGSALRYTDSDRGIPVDSRQRLSAPEVSQSVERLWTASESTVFQIGGRWEHLEAPGLGNPSRSSGWAGIQHQSGWARDRLVFSGAIRADRVGSPPETWSPKVGVSVSPWSWMAIKANAGNSFRAPNFSELYLQQGFLQGNPDLKPERALGLDAGIQIRTTPLFFETALFRNEVRDLIEYVLVSGFRYKPFNFTRARVQGVEGSIEARPFHGIGMAAGFTLIDARDTSGEPNRDGRQLPGKPRHQAHARLTLTQGPVRPFAEFRYVGGNFVTEANTKQLPARRGWNLGTAWEWGKIWSGSIEWRNLADERAVDVRGFPLPGRAWFLTLQAHF